MNIYKPRGLTFSFKVVAGIAVKLDVYPPKLNELPPQDHIEPKVPGVVYFHGGGLNAGNRQSWFPSWLQSGRTNFTVKYDHLFSLARVNQSGYAFISAEHRLMPPSTVHDMLEDVKDLFAFISERLNSLLDSESQIPVQPDSAMSSDPFHRFRIDSDRLAVAGTSSGGLLAYLAAAHALPKPKAVLAIYALGGNMFCPHFLSEKQDSFTMRGRRPVDPEDYKEFIYPESQNLAVIADSPIGYHPASSVTPGFPANPRMLLHRVYFQSGKNLDYMTGEHEPSLSESLRAALDGVSQDDSKLLNETLREFLPKEHHDVFPQLNVTKDWPPTFLMHGENDSVLPVEGTRHIYALLKEAGVPCTLRVFEGEEHSFDYAQSAGEKCGEEFDSAVAFIKEHI